MQPQPEIQEEWNADRFAGDPPVTDEERTLPFKVDPSRDYFAEIDRMQPPWVPPQAEYLNGSFPTSAAFSDASGTREMRVTEKDSVTKKTVRRSRTMPHKRYVRAIDPQGNLCALIVSTCRPDKEKPHGDDGLETFSRVIARKSRLGWLVVEPNEDTHSPYAGKMGMEYIAWALEVMQYRKKKYGAWINAEQSIWMEEKKRQAVELARLQGAALGESVGNAIRESMGESRRGKKSE